MKAALMTPFLLFLGFGAWGAGTEPATVKTAATPTADSVRDSAGDTKSSNQMGQVLNIVSGAANLYQAQQEAAACGPHNTYSCVMSAVHFGMGVLNFAQAGAQGSTARQAGGTYSLTDTLGSDPYASTTLTGGYDPNAALKDPAVRDAETYIAKMSGTEVPAGSPFVYNPKTNTITTASGKTVKTSDLSSAAAMAAAGIPQNVIDATTSSEKQIYADAMKKIAKYKVAGGGSAEESAGGGGGGWGTGAGDGSGNGSGVAGSRGVAGVGGAHSGLGHDPTNLAGMQKDYHGEPIGVAGDSIFKMMTRRYKVKESQRSFFDESELLIQK
jgi:hypothetical protein